jgi:uncharacterized protein YjbJ (UPF0337 family)
MNWNQAEAQWEQRKRNAERHWETMKNDELAVVDGKRQEFIGKLRKQYGIANQEVGEQKEQV